MSENEPPIEANPSVETQTTQTEEPFHKVPEGTYALHLTAIIEADYLPKDDESPLDRLD